ncbi:MAG: hypothetical protein BWY09_02158 [Candidatus Hydrogenedentes bacterium ADurb.Bin179]|nr:MAG: hypothetical protein BWY09_02158 [Candidatus Hydrogenedentes bacterium ADurb.Bin179]
MLPVSPLRGAFRSQYRQYQGVPFTGPALARRRLEGFGRTIILLALPRYLAQQKTRRDIRRRFLQMRLQYFGRFRQVAAARQAARLAYRVPHQVHGQYHQQYSGSQQNQCRRRIGEEPPD